MEYTERQVMDAFAIYAQLAAKGEIACEDVGQYYMDDAVRSLVERFAKQVNCTIISDMVKLYLVPLAQVSPFHMSNDTFKKLYLPAKALNLDIYMMYLAIIILIGKFYDSYQTDEAAEFVTMEAWLSDMDERIGALDSYSAEKLAALDQEYNFNWSALRVKWADLDDVKETVKRQDARTNSRVSFLNMTKEFLKSQNLLLDIGNQEMQLTEKAKTIILRYYMEFEHNRGILDFMYAYDHKKEARTDAGNQ